jgi:adenine phosphoribosyltransferase
MDELKKKIREVPDFPKPGILFYDLTTLLGDKIGLRQTMDLLTDKYSGQKIDQVLGIESRGFIFAPVLAYNLGAGFVPVRKPGKLPYKTRAASYELEYGSDSLEIHEDAVKPGQRVLIVDDLIATGGTAAATLRLARSLGAEVAGLAFLVELEELAGREKLDGYDVFSLLKY